MSAPHITIPPGSSLPAFDGLEVHTEAANGLLRLALLLTPCLRTAAIALAVALARVCERAGVQEEEAAGLVRVAHRASAAVGEDDQ